MNNRFSRIFFLPVLAGKWIQRRMGKGVKGVISYVIFYFIVTGLLFIITDEIDTFFIDQMFYFFNTYLLLGMYYVFFYYWRESKE